MKYTSEQLEAMAQKLRDLPPVEKSKQHFSRQEAVTRLKAEIATLQKRGYSLEQVSEALRAVGIEIATPTLKSYLQRAKGSAPRARAEKRPRAPSESAVSGRSSKPSGLGHAVLNGQNGSAAKEASTKATFELKEDTDDI